MDDTGDGSWLQISLQCPEILLEPITDILGVLSGSGVEQSPVKGEQSTVTAFFHLKREDEHEQLLAQVMEEVEQLFRLYQLNAPMPTWKIIEDQDWSTSWQQFFKPFAIIPGLVIKPSWESYEAEPAEQVIEMDPGRAFGTGQHASTRLALAFIHDCCRKKAPQRVLDVGTGTGILAMAAVRFGAGQATAIDNDPEAVRVARENVAINGLEQQISCSARELADISESFELVCANIIHDVLVAMAAALVHKTAPGGHLILAGILSGAQEDNITAVYQALGLRLLKTAYEDEWVSLLFTKDGRG